MVVCVRPTGVRRARARAYGRTSRVPSADRRRRRGCVWKSVAAGVFRRVVVACAVSLRVPVQQSRARTSSKYRTFEFAKTSADPSLSSVRRFSGFSNSFFCCFLCYFSLFSLALVHPSERRHTPARTPWKSRNGAPAVAENRGNAAFVFAVRRVVLGKFYDSPFAL